MHISLDSAIGQQRRLNQVGETISSISAPTAAYSLRSLTGGDPRVVRVRRESDNTERDFTVSGVNSGALEDFCDEATPARNRTGGAKYSSFSVDGVAGFSAVCSAAAACGYDIFGASSTAVQVSFDIVLNSGSVSVKLRPEFETGSDVSNSVTINSSGSKSFTLTSTAEFKALLFISGATDFVVSNFLVNVPYNHSAFVETWYDQSGNGNDATQTTAANQPKIVSSGSLVVDSAGLPEINFDGSNDCLTASSYSRSGEDLPLTMISVFDQDVEGVDYIVALTQSDNNSFDRILLRADDFEYGRRDVANSSKSGAGSDPDVNTKYVFTAINAGTTSSGFVNGSSIFSGVNTNVGTQALDQIDIGANNGDSASNANPFDGKIQEIIIYETDQSSNRTALETNINSHYSIF